MTEQVENLEPAPWQEEYVQPKLEDYNRATRRQRFGQSNKHLPVLLQLGPSERAVKRVSGGRTR